MQQIVIMNVEPYYNVDNVIPINMEAETSHHPHSHKMSCHGTCFDWHQYTCWQLLCQTDVVFGLLHLYMYLWIARQGPTSCSLPIRSLDWNLE